MYYISKTSGAGGFLNPPQHPEHSMSVRDNDPKKAMSCSLSYAVENLDGPIKEQAQKVLDQWQPLPLTHPETKAWIREILGYFENCYKGQGDEKTCWHAENLRIAKIDPLLNVDLHAGVNFIRKYYPHYVPTETEFKEAKWGK